MITAQEFAGTEFSAPGSSAPGSSASDSSASDSSASTVQARRGRASTTGHDERTVASVLATLHQQFPQADPGTVQTLVDQRFAEFGGARVTTYVPVLVLHACQQQLRGA